jgi:8-oxo-dGTP pyrophosphatase MutT (NUDIX family)
VDKHFTATAYIIQDGKVLLIFHHKLQKWLPPGGHIELNETPPEAAKREVREETGLEVEIIKQENVWQNNWNANSFERPFMCLLENVPPHKDVPAHQHMDLIYVARPAGGQEFHHLVEKGELRWFSLDEVLAMESDVAIFEETQSTIKHLLS